MASSMARLRCLRRGAAVRREAQDLADQFAVNVREPLGANSLMVSNSDRSPPILSSIDRFQGQRIRRHRFRNRYLRASKSIPNSAASQIEIGHARRIDGVATKLNGSGESACKHGANIRTIFSTGRGNDDVVDVGQCFARKATAVPAPPLDEFRGLREDASTSALETAGISMPFVRGSDSESATTIPPRWLNRSSVRAVVRHGRMVFIDVRQTRRAQCRFYLPQLYLVVAIDDPPLASPIMGM